jgi:hypothetical protein
MRPQKGSGRTRRRRVPTRGNLLPPATRSCHQPPESEANQLGKHAVLTLPEPRQLGQNAVLPLPRDRGGDVITYLPRDNRRLRLPTQIE